MATVSEAAAKQPLTAADWKRIAAIFIFFVFTMLFWAAYEQKGASLNLFAERARAHRDLRHRISVELPAIVHTAVCDLPGADIFVPLGESERSSTVESGEVHARLVVHWRGLPADDSSIDVDGPGQELVRCGWLVFTSSRFAARCV